MESFIGMVFKIFLYNYLFFRDIKAGNILINTDIRVKLSDFGSFY
jgi:serine/threonine protein kinase